MKMAITSKIFFSILKKVLIEPDLGAGAWSRDRNMHEKLEYYRRTITAVLECARRQTCTFLINGKVFLMRAAGGGLNPSGPRECVSSEKLLRGIKGLICVESIPLPAVSGLYTTVNITLHIHLPPIVNRAPLSDLPCQKSEQKPS